MIKSLFDLAKSISSKGGQKVNRPLKNYLTKFKTQTIYAIITNVRSTLPYTLLLLSVVFGPLCSTQQETIAPLLDM